MLIGVVGKFLSEDVRAITRKQGGYCLLCLCIRTFDVFKVRSLIAVGTVVSKRGIGAEAVFVDVEADGLCQYAMSTDMGVAGDADELLCGLVGDDIDDTCDGVRAIE